MTDGGFYVGESMLSRFFGVVVRPATWLNILFQVLSFPLGLFYFIFLVVGLSVGIGLVVVWIGIPIVLLVAGAWWLFGAFERLQAQYLLGADVGPAPRAWESVDGVWAKLKAHFGCGATWKDLVYLLAKMVFGSISFTLLITLAGIVAWMAVLPISAILRTPVGTLGEGHVGWIPPLWLAVAAVPVAVITAVASLHVVNAWGWICARWAEALLGRVDLPGRAAPVAPAPLVSTSPAPAPVATLPPIAPPPAPPVAPPVAPPAAPAVPAASPPGKEASPASSEPDVPENSDQ